MTQAYYRKTPQQALEAQNASAEGLSAQEARRRAEQYGPNKLSEGKKKSTLQVFLEQFKDLMVLILIIAAVISAFSGNVESTIVIFAVLVLNAILGTVQYEKAEKSLESLKAMASPTAKVMRGGVRVEIPSADVVPGDIVLLEAGDMAEAVRCLGHPHVLTGPVVSGRHLGRTIGIPTANLALPPQLLCPRHGVYAALACFDGRRLPAVVNIGSRPTVGGTHVTVEPWILDFDGDLYGRTLRLEFYTFLRPERKFDSLDELRAAILHNAEQTREFFCDR